MPWEKVDIDQWAEELGVNINELRQKEQLIQNLENHAEDIKLSTLNKVATALGKRLEVSLK